MIFAFIVSLFKIFIFTTLYSTLVFTVLWLIGKTNPPVYIENVLSVGSKYWFLIWCTIGFCLFMYRFSWADRGLYDTAIIPIGYEQEIHCSDGYTFLTMKQPDDQVQIKTYLIHQNLICAEVVHEETFLIYNLETFDVSKFENKEKYNTYAQSQDLPLSSSFKDFWEYYREYWGGWKSWLLP